MLRRDMQTQTKYVIGVDFGSDSVRCLIVGTADGAEIASAVAAYPRWKERLYCDPSLNRYRQHPLDYIESLEQCVRSALEKCGKEVADNICGISFDTTASTPALTDERGVPLALLPEYAENPDAMFVLWKDHTALAEADEINDLAKRWEVDYTRYSGGAYSCEWVWAKMLHCLRSDPALRAKTCSWVEHCDWICALLTGDTKPETIARSRCAAGHKAMWHESWGGLPSPEFLSELYVAMYDAACAHDITRVREIQRRIMQISTSVYTVGKYGSSYLKGVKCALSLLGVCDDYLSYPYRKFRTEERARIRQALEALGANCNV